MKCEVLTVLSYLDPLYPCHLSGQVVFKEVRSFDRDVIIGQVKRMFLFYHVSYQVCIMLVHVHTWYHTAAVLRNSRTAAAGTAAAVLLLTIYSNSNTATHWSRRHNRVV